MKTILFTVSEGASIDQATNAVSIYTIVENIEPVGLPVMMQKIVITLIVVRDENDPDTISGTLSILNNETPIHDKWPASIEFNERRSARLMITINGLLIQHPGVLIFKYASDVINELFTLTVSNPKAKASHNSGEGTLSSKDTV